MIKINTATIISSDQIGFIRGSGYDENIVKLRVKSKEIIKVAIKGVKGILLIELKNPMIVLI